MTSYKVVSVPGSTPCRAVFMTLEELEQPYEIVRVSLEKGEHKTPEFLLKNQPFGQIPVLWDGDYRLFESRAIVRYLTSKHKSSTLYPEDLQTRGLVEQWLSVGQSNNGPIIDIFVEFYIGPTFYGKVPDEEKRASMQANVDKYLAVLDGHLATSDYFAGQAFTIADICFIPYIQYLLYCKGFEGVLDKHEHFKCWWEKVSARPSWQKVASRPN